MRVVMIYEVDDEKVKRIMSHDLHGEDAIDQINYLAERSESLGTWHFSKASFKDISQALIAVWLKYENMEVSS